MRMGEANGRVSVAGLLIGAMLAASPASAQMAAELRELIELQRQQIERQAEQLKLLEQRLEEVEASAIRSQQAEPRVEPAPVAAETTVVCCRTGIDLALSGQINRMVTAGYDGDDTKLYNVDNVNSSSRLRVVGSAKAEAVTIGTHFEFEMRSNASTEVSQANEDTGVQGFRERLVEVFFEHADFGKVTIGQGDTAANGTAEVDLSGTSVIAYSSISDTAGGLLFFDDDADALSGTSIGNVFNNFDALSRQDRIRYDTPTFLGFTAAADAISDQRWSGAVRWSGKNDTINAAAAFGYSDPGGDRDWILSSSASVLHVPTGVSLTLAASGRDNSNRDDALSLYGKIGYQQDFFTFGRTHLGVDLARNDDVAVEDDEATSIGLFAVQNVKDFGIELYGLYRWHELDRQGTDLADIHIFTLGTRVRF